MFELFVATLPNDIELWWDGYSQLYVDAPGSLKSSNQFGGLCGDFNGIQKDDFATQEGDLESDPSIFANRFASLIVDGSGKGQIWPKVDKCRTSC